MRQEALTRVKGYLSRDAELRHTRDGRAVLDVTVPFQRSRFNKQTNQYENIGETLWVRASLWDEAATSSAEKWRKGVPVIIEGVPDLRQWESDGRSGVAFELLFAQVSIVAEARRRTQAEPAPPPLPEDAWATPGAFEDDTPF